MNDQYVMGYKINTNIKHYLPNTVLFIRNDEKITVAMAQDAVDYILGVLARKNPLIDAYKKAKTVFSAIKLMLENKQPSRVTKADVKIAIDVLEEIQNNIYRKACDFRSQHIIEVDSYDEFKEKIEEGGFILAHWDGTPETEARIKEETKATIRCIPLEGDMTPGVCMVTGKPSARRVLFARAY